jgi:hypothetical protein
MGKLEYFNGDKYEGDVKNGKPHGKGEYISDGDIFEGNFIHGVFTAGKITYEDGSVFEGDVVNYEPHGKGIHTWLDGEKYEGDFANGKPHGKGTYTWPGGKIYKGIFSEGKMKGKGEFLSDGINYIGNIKDDKALNGNNGKTPIFTGKVAIPEAIPVKNPVIISNAIPYTGNEDLVVAESSVEGGKKTKRRRNNKTKSRRRRRQTRK